MKVARSALHLPLAPWERAGVRETAMASSAFHGLGWRWSPWPLAKPHGVLPSAGRPSGGTGWELAAARHQGAHRRSQVSGPVDQTGLLPSLIFRVITASVIQHPAQTPSL